MVHANLAPHLHPHCVKEIDGLHECHASKSVGRWFGMCNQARDDLEKCLAAEFLKTQKEQRAKTKRQREATRKILAGGEREGQA